MYECMYVRGGGLGEFADIRVGEGGLTRKGGGGCFWKEIDTPMNIMMYVGFILFKIKSFD